MSIDEKRKQLERQARSLLISKDISADEREQVNALMKNQGLSPEDRYGSIIRLISKAPDKEFDEIPDIEIPHDNNSSEKQHPVIAKKKEPVK